MILLLFSDHRSIQKNIWLLHSPLKQRATTDNAICIISLSISILEKISKFLLITKYVFVVDISYFLLWIYACLATLNLHTSETAKSHLEWTNGIVQDQSASDDCGQIHFYGSGLLSGNKNDCTLIISQISLTKAIWDKLTSMDLVLIQETKEQSLKINKLKDIF